MKLTNASSIPVYTVSGSSTARPLPEFLARKRRRSSRRETDETNRVELLQDFEFEESSSCIRISEDGEWVVSTGTYKPQIHVHYLPHLSLSFARHTDSLNETFQLLSSDYSKSIHLQSDRRIDIHTAGGRHESVRIPRYGRDLKWIKNSTEALIPAVGIDSDGNGEVFRLNLELGRFMKSYSVDIGVDDPSSSGVGSLQGSVNAGAVNAAASAQYSHNLLAFGTSLGTVEFHDPRSRSRVGILSSTSSSTSMQDSTALGNAEISVVQFHPQGLTFATGNSQGLIHVYDLRSPIPLLQKDQGYGFPIKTLTFLTSSTSSNRTAQLSSEPKILSADKRIIKIWDTSSGAPWTAVEPVVDLNSVAWFPDSGMLLTANEGREQHSFFIPQLGPAPKWCSFLDNLVEEMAEDPNDPSAYRNVSHTAGEVYDNYKFVTLSQLRSLSLDHLVGKTGLLRPYMHGYFINQDLHAQAQLINQPDLWQDVRQQRIKERIEKERESRIRGTDKKLANVKVNKSLAERLQQQQSKREERNELRKARRAIKKGEQYGLEENGVAQLVQEDSKPSSMQDRPSVLTDPRFSRVFADDDFAIDETSREFAALNAGSARSQHLNTKDFNSAQKLTAAEQEELSDENRGFSDSDESMSESDLEHQTQRNRQSYSNGDMKITPASYTRNAKGGQSRVDGNRRRGLSNTAEPKMRVTNSKSNDTHGKEKFARNKTFGSRVASLPSQKNSFTKSNHDRSSNIGGDKSITFAPGSSNKSKPGNGSSGNRRRGLENQRRTDRRSASGNVLRRL